MADFLEYNDVTCENRGRMAEGRLKLTDEKIVFKFSNHKTSNEIIPQGDIDLVNWQRLAGSWGLRIFTGDGELHRFAGFKESEKEKLAKFFNSTYKKEMTDCELSVKGWNWGQANFRGSVLGFTVGGKHDAFEVPLSYVNQCIPGKNEVTLEFHLNEDAAVNLSELRFHIPASETEDAVDAFKERVMKKASVVDSTGAAMAIISNVHCLSPRGRYDIKIHPTFIHLHGKTFDYKIQCSTIMRLFLLPHKDQRQRYFAVNVDPPIRQGQTRYHYLVLTFNQEDEEEVELPFTEDELKEKFDGKLDKEIRGPTYEVFATILRALVNKKITVPGSFLGHSGTPAISCSYKAASGFIYPLERGFIFVYKPPIYLRYDEVRYVTLERSGGTTRSFDISIVLTNNDIVYTFSSIEKGEYSKLYDFLKNKKLAIKISGKTDKKSTGIDWSNETAVDHHKHMLIAKANEFSSGGEDMSSDDTDFNPDALEALSAKEEYDSEPSTTSSEDGSDDNLDEQQREEKRKRKEEKRAKREKKASSSAPRKKREGKKKRTKLPGQPKRNQSAYFLWMNENRENIKKEFPNLTVAEFGKKAGELWKELKDKTEWDAKAAEDKKRYDREFTEWKSSDNYAEAMKQAKQEKKSAKMASSSKPSVSKAPAAKNPVSKEFIETDSSSDDEKDKKKPAEKKESSEDESMKSDSDSD